MQWNNPMSSLVDTMIHNQIDAKILDMTIARHGSPSFVKSSATDRQKLYEGCVTLGGLVMLFAEVGKQDPASARAARSLAGQALAMVGIASQADAAPVAGPSRPHETRHPPCACSPPAPCYGAIANFRVSRRPRRSTCTAIVPSSRSAG